MASEINDNKDKSEQAENVSGQAQNNPSPGRRKVLKALAGLPVLGLLGAQVLRQTSYDNKHSLQKQIVDELGLSDLMSSVKPVTASGGDILRIGIAGFGVRGRQLAASLGFMEKSEFEKKMATGALDAQLSHGNLNVAITGICEVFDLHAERGLEIAQHDIFTGGEIAKKHPVKRYRTYQDMMADKNIDAVIISTPDHHHAQMTIDAAKAGKHIYTEKAIIRREEEIEPLYHAVKNNSGKVFQAGHQYPQNSVFQQAKEILDRGMLGKISHLETTTNRNSEEGAWIRHLYKNGKPKPGNEKSIDWKQWLGNAPDVPFSIKRFYSWARYFTYDTGLYGQLFSHEYDAMNQLLGIGIPDTVVATGGQYYYTDFGDIPDVLHTNFEFPDKGYTLTYSSNLTSSKYRPRSIYGRDAWMAVGGDLTVTPDGESEKYSDMIKRELINPSAPMIEIKRGSLSTNAVDAVSSASTRYYEDRGLVSTNIGGRIWDVNHLHLKEWIDCIRNGGTPSADIEKAYEVGVTIAMADISYREKCRTKWDSKNRKILRI
ncbi:MAG: Gfo/Idh/MocA family oxidoreductase [Bacteroidales bacterium]